MNRRKKKKDIFKQWLLPDGEMFSSENYKVNNILLRESVAHQKEERKVIFCHFPHYFFILKNNNLSNRAKEKEIIFFLPKTES